MKKGVEILAAQGQLACATRIDKKSFNLFRCCRWLKLFCDTDEIHNEFKLLIPASWLGVLVVGHILLSFRNATKLSRVMSGEPFGPRLGLLLRTVSNSPSSNRSMPCVGMQ